MTTLRDVLVRHHAVVAYLFGSRAAGTAGPLSDHDVAVLFARDPGLDGTERLAADLAELWNTPVDVVDLDRADLELRGAVAERGRLLHSTDEVRRVRFEVDTRMRWIEFRSVLDETSAAFLRRVARSGLR